MNPRPAVAPGAGSGGPDDVDEATACAAALAALPGMTPARLSAVVRDRSPEEAWVRVRRGWVPERLRPTEGAEALGAAWSQAAAALAPADAVAAWAAVGVVPVRPATRRWGTRLEGLDPPVTVLFARGDDSAPARVCVAMVGTRRATALGREVASVLGHDLATVGAAVVSGLAAGIDAAAHTGALAAGPGGGPPVGVVGSGLDVPYPKANAGLWDAVATAGLLLSEHPPGTGPQPHHFPLRNRIVAALADVVVVVESHRRGGALITVERALELGRPVAVVPGSLRNPAAEGTNALLRDGATPVLDASDVLALAGVIDPVERDADEPAGDRPHDPVERDVLDAIGEGATVDDLAARTGRSLAELVAALDRLDDRGVLAPKGPFWYRVIRGRAW